VNNYISCYKLYYIGYYREVMNKLINIILTGFSETYIIITKCPTEICRSKAIKSLLEIIIKPETHSQIIKISITKM